MYHAQKRANKLIRKQNQPPSNLLRLKIKIRENRRSKSNDYKEKHYFPFHPVIEMVIRLIFKDQSGFGAKKEACRMTFARRFESLVKTDQPIPTPERCKMSGWELF